MLWLLYPCYSFHPNGTRNISLWDFWKLLFQLPSKKTKCLKYTFWLKGFFFKSITFQPHFLLNIVHMITCMQSIIYKYMRRFIYKSNINFSVHSCINTFSRINQIRKCYSRIVLVRILGCSIEVNVYILEFLVKFIVYIFTLCIPWIDYLWILWIVLEAGERGGWREMGEKDWEKIWMEVNTSSEKIKTLKFNQRKYFLRILHSGFRYLYKKY